MPGHAITRLSPELAVDFLQTPSLADELVDEFLGMRPASRAQIVADMDEEFRTRLFAKVGPEIAGELKSDMEDIKNFEQGTYSDTEPKQLTEEQDNALMGFKCWPMLEELCTIHAKMPEKDWIALKRLGIALRGISQSNEEDDDDDGSGEELHSDTEKADQDDKNGEVKAEDDKNGEVKAEDDKNGELKVADGPVAISVPPRRRRPAK
jgi:hypothetical protein